MKGLKELKEEKGNPAILSITFSIGIFEILNNI